MGDRILITGAQGFVGRYLAAHWLRDDPAATVLGVGRSPRLQATFAHAVSWGGTRAPAPLPATLSDALRSARSRYLSLDVLRTRDVAALVSAFRPTVVVHLAAALRDDPPDRLFRTNVQGALSLLEGVVAAGIEPPRIVLGSSGSVYGSAPPDALPLQERRYAAPEDLYAVSKQAGENAACIVARRHALPIVRARIFNVVGPGQDERHLCGWIASQAAAIAAGAAPPVVTTGPLETTRDFVAVRDVARALKVLAERGVPGEAYNVASGVETPVAHVVDETIRLAGIDGRVRRERTSARPADVPRQVADIGRLCALGFMPRVSLTDVLTELLRYYRETVAPAAEGVTSGRSARPA